MNEALAKGGLYEVFQGTADLKAAAAYWAAFGYQVEAEANLPAALASELYGHRSDARVARLRSTADHGLVRLIEWAEPANAGLGTSGLRAHGNRWVGHFTRSVLTIANHAAAAKNAGEPLQLGAPHFIDMGRAYGHLFGGKTPRAFADELICLREVQMFRDETRQVFLERFGYDSPMLGTFADDSLMRATQIVQGCMVVASEDPGVFDFYLDVLGLWKSFDHTVPWDEAQASREVFSLTPGETHWNVDMDEPESKPSLAERRSGRLKCFRFSTRHPIEDVSSLASPGALGFSNYSWRVRDVNEAYSRVLASEANEKTQVLEDEFGDKAISFRAPDGYFWTFIER